MLIIRLRNSPPSACRCGIFLAKTEIAGRVRKVGTEKPSDLGGVHECFGSMPPTNPPPYRLSHVQAPHDFNEIGVE